jgi:hypothetical protein
VKVAAVRDFGMDGPDGLRRKTFGPPAGIFGLGR